jgi:hypothetical protein
MVKQPGRQKTIESRTGPKIDDRFPLPQRGQGNGIPASQAEVGPFGHGQEVFGPISDGHADILNGVSTAAARGRGEAARRSYAAIWP